MKYIFILIFSFVTLVTYSQDFPVMLNLKSDVTVPDDFRDGVEEALTNLGYSLVDDKAQKEALKENAKARNSECYDDECLVDTGKMLAAKALIVVEVEVKSETAYKFKVRFIDFEKGTTTKTISKYYEESLKNYKELMKFGKELTFSLLKNTSMKKEVKPEKVIVKVVEKNNDKVNPDSKEKIDELKEEITKLNNKLNNKLINPRKENKASLSFSAGDSTITGLKYSYFLSYNFEFSAFLGISSGVGVNFHFFADSVSGSTFYIGIDTAIIAATFFDESPVVIYTHIGYQYQSQESFIFSINVGQITLYSESIPWAGIKIGYVFN